MLTVSKLETAAANCGFTVNGKELSVLLDSANLTLDAIHARPRSAALQQQIEANAASFQSDRETACTRAWETFGADAYPGARDLLQK
ncbi:hypothetical protein [Lichenifustis flavocetrariae]|uniref:Uncharacterized protein n=1 Tax=Lichenifustis flavocetrariae TaxID=2949735 RepID=A0AA41Z3K5_9HYPH|nr:hypothetical protein [Lichenifustis flavocetrariae]MCW6512412.1 hypothetical protein [Lichenifustis flavocetrariae]